jgi:dolichyl-phosphate-mannose--protein O-mannosyl transferase
MFQEISYYLIFGMPFILYLGIITIVMFTITALIAILKRRNKLKIAIKWHFRLAYISIALALIHGFLGIMAYF